MKSQKRLFIGIPISEVVIHKIEAIQLLWKRQLDENEISLIPKENYHLTLHFLGNTPVEQIPSLEEKLERHAKTPRCFYALNRFLAFPEPKRARVLALSGVIGVSPLSQLHFQMKETLQSLRMKIEDRVYIPHLTLFRVRELSLIHPFPIEKGIEVPIESFALYESLLTQQGSQYRILKKWELK